MRKFAFIFLTAVFAISAAEAPRVSRVLMTSVEKSLDEKIIRMWPDNPTALIGASRGVYLPGYGIVMSAEMNLVTANISMMNPMLTEPEKVAFRKTKIERIPQLKKALKDALVAVAVSLDTVPPTDKVTIAIVLPRYAWEDQVGVPLQVVAEGTRQQLLAARSGGAALEAAVKITESN